MIRFISSGRFFPTVVVIILPFLVIILPFLVSTSSINYVRPWIFVSDITLLIVYTFSTALPTEKYFKLRGFENSVIEFQYVKKILITAVILLIANIVILAPYRPYMQSTGTIADIWYFTILITSSTLVRITFQIAKKQFRFYSAKAYFIIASRQDDDYKKIRYFNSGLNSYNKYLRRRLKVEINDLKKVYSKFLLTHTTEKQEIIKSVCESLEDRDRLKLARYLSTLSKIPETELFVSESLLQKLKIIGAFLAASIPIIVSIIQLIRPVNPH